MPNWRNIPRKKNSPDIVIPDTVSSEDKVVYLRKVCRQIHKLQNLNKSNCNKLNKKNYSNL